MEDKYKDFDFDDMTIEDNSDDFGDYFDKKPEQVNNQGNLTAGTPVAEPIQPVVNTPVSEATEEQHSDEIGQFDNDDFSDIDFGESSEPEANTEDDFNKFLSEETDEAKIEENVPGTFEHVEAEPEHVETEPEPEDVKDEAQETEPEQKLSKKELKKLKKQQEEEAKRQAEEAKKQAKLAKKQSKSDKKNSKKNKKAEVEEPEVPEEELPKPDMSLYVLIDSSKNGIMSYLRSLGLNVSEVSNKLDDTRGYLLRHSEPTRVVVVDSGTGKFVTTSIRKELVDMLGTADENLRFTVFYTDSVLKSDSINELGETAQDIEWIPYKSSLILAGIMLKHHENYIYRGNQISEESDKLSLDLMGIPITYNEDFEEDKPVLIHSDIATKMTEDSSSDLVGFIPHI